MHLPSFVELYNSITTLVRRRPGIVLALCGGGARGIAHLGVLEVLERRGIRVAGIAGTSAGALIGAMWLAHGSVDAAERRWREVFASGLLPGDLPNVRFRPSVEASSNLLVQLARRLQRGAALAFALERRSLLPRESVTRVIDFLLPDLAIEQLRLPFAAVATDFETGRPVSLRTGSLRDAVTASSSVPGAMEPSVIDGRALLDGGVVADVPVVEARALARGPVVAVDTGETLPADDVDAISVPSALVRANLMTHKALREQLLSRADLVLRPDSGLIHWSQFSLFDQAVEAGRAAAEANVGRLVALAGSGRAGVELTGLESGRTDQSLPAGAA